MGLSFLLSFLLCQLIFSVNDLLGQVNGAKVLQTLEALRKLVNPGQPKSIEQKMGSITMNPPETEQVVPASSPSSKVVGTGSSSSAPALTTPSSTAADDFPTLGITLKGIQAFIALNGGAGAFTNLRTTDVCEKFLKPSTAAAQESYCVAFESDQERHAHINQATAFVSHAWGHQFLDMIAALEDYDSHQPVPTFFWFDIFSNNQHKTPNLISRSS